MMITSAFVKRFLSNFFQGPAWSLPSPLLRKLEKYTTGESFLAKLFRIPYFLFFWISSWYERITTKTLRLLFVAFFIILFFSIIFPRSMVKYVFFILCGFQLQDAVGGFLFRPRVSVQRSLPNRVECGDTFSIRYLLKNLRKIPVYDLSPDVMLPDFHFLEMESDGGMISLNGGCEAEMEYRFLAPQRGIYTIPQCMVTSAFPFHLWRHNCAGGPRNKLIVYPRYYELNHISSAQTGQKQRRNLTTSGTAGDSLDFYGCRKYRAGDSLSRIFWKGSAKHGELLVKEFQAEHVSRASVILDTRRKGSLIKTDSLHDFIRELTRLLNKDLYRNDPLFEAEISLCASVIHTLTCQDFHIDLFATGEEIRRYSVNDSRNSREDIMDLLASARNGKADSFRIIREELAEELAESGCVFLLLLNAGNESRKLFETLVSEGADVRTLLIVPEIPQNPPEWIHVCATPAQISEGKVRLP